MTAAFATLELRETDQPLGAPRDPAARERYLHAAWSHIPRLLGAIDRNPYRATYGCLDRQFWHYRTAAFPSEMYQEGVLPLALVATTRLPGNRWHGQPRVRQLAIAALRFAARSSHGDGSCDDYYPFERALGAAAFSFAAATEAYRLLWLDDADLMAWFRRRAGWLMRHDESGHLTNHHALIALGLARLAALTGEAAYAHAAAERVERVLSWQSDEGWFDEYGGADPGYQTVTIDCLAKYARLTDTNPTCRRESAADSGSLAERSWSDLCERRSRGDSPSLTVSVTQLDDALRSAVSFARLFLHPDDSYGGPYGSRGTRHFYPHGMELLAGENADAADLADGFLRALASGRHAHFDDDRMFAHRLGNLIEAYRDWSPQRAAPQVNDDGRQVDRTTFLPHAGLLIRRTGGSHAIISTARGGVFQHFAAGQGPITDAGLIVEFSDGRVAVSQQHQSTTPASGRRQPADGAASDVCASSSGRHVSLTVSRPLHFVRHETATPLKQAIFHVAMCTAGRFCRTAIRKLLQRRLITGRAEAPLRLTRQFEWLGDSPTPPWQEGRGVARPEQGCDGRGEASPRPSRPCSERATLRREGQSAPLSPLLGEGRGEGLATLRVIDIIELTSPAIAVRRMSYGTDHESAYVAASGVYQESLLEPWTDLADSIAELNERRRVTIVREW